MLLHLIQLDVGAEEAGNNLHCRSWSNKDAARSWHKVSGARLGETLQCTAHRCGDVGPGFEPDTCCRDSHEYSDVHMADCVRSSTPG